MSAKAAKLLAVLFLVLVGIVLEPAAHPFESGPIVQRVRPQEAVILLHTRSICAGELELWPRDTGGPSRTLTTGSGRRHVFEIDGLAPSTSWHYRVRVWDPRGHRRVAGHGSFRTAPSPGTGSVRFVAFGDSGKIPWWLRMGGGLPVGPARWLQQVLPGRGKQWDVARMIARRRPQLLLHLGDVVYPTGSRTHYPEALFLPFGEVLARAPFYPAIGNHDLITENGAPFFEAFELPGPASERPRRYYEFVHGPARFFCLDTFSSSLEPGSEQWRWLVAALKNAREPWRIVFTHRPFWTVSRSQYDAANKRLREQVHPLFVRSGVSLVLSGHDHVYERYQPKDGISYVVAGGGGKSLYYIDDDPDLAAAFRRYSFVLAEADERSMRLRAIASNGEVLDEWSLAPRR